MYLETKAKDLIIETDTNYDQHGGSYLNKYPAIKLALPFRNKWPSNYDDAAWGWFSGPELSLQRCRASDLGGACFPKESISYMKMSK